MARLTGQDSAFGREFDSLADIVSFGIAPSLLVHEIVLAEIPDRWGWIIAFIYLLCGAMRLARFNCLAGSTSRTPRRILWAFPIPAAAGVISSLTLLLMWLDARDRPIGGVEVGSALFDAAARRDDDQQNPLPEFQGAQYSAPAARCRGFLSRSWSRC